MQERHGERGRREEKVVNSQVGRSEATEDSVRVMWQGSAKLCESKRSEYDVGKVMGEGG